jgi:hypothetical protein
MSHRHRLQRRFWHQFRLAADPSPALTALADSLEIEPLKLTARDGGGMPLEGTRRLRDTIDRLHALVQFLKDWGEGRSGGASGSHNTLRLRKES